MENYSINKRRKFTDMWERSARCFVALLAAFFYKAFALQLPCTSFNTPHDGSSNYWIEVSNCSKCVQAAGCGFCLSSLLCMRSSWTSKSSMTRNPNSRSQSLGIFSCYEHDCTKNKNFTSLNFTISL